MQAAPESHSSSSLRGILMIVVGLSIAALVGALMKLRGGQISALQVAWFPA